MNPLILNLYTGYRSVHDFMFQYLHPVVINTGVNLLWVYKLVWALWTGEKSFVPAGFRTRRSRVTTPTTLPLLS